MSSFSLPLFPAERTARNHAILCTVGFLVLLPIGVLVARYTRTWTNRWWLGHGMIQFLISGPVIFAGWAMGHMAANQLPENGHFKDPHQRMGLTLLILYLIQLLLGVFIHFFKFPSSFRGRRPPQNYFHAFLGLVILAIAASQVHYGLYTEWLLTGNIHFVPQSAKHAWLALIVIFWVLYAAGLAFLPKQFKQEAKGRDVDGGNSTPLHNRNQSSTPDA